MAMLRAAIAPVVALAGVAAALPVGDPDLRFTNVLLTGQPAPDLGPDIFLHFIFEGTIDRAGTVLTQAHFQGPGVNSSNNYAVYAGTPGSMRMVSRLSDPVAGATPGAYVGTWPAMARSEDGTFVLTTRVEGPGVNSSNDGLILAGQRGALRTTAWESAPAPGTDSLFTNINFRAVANASGRYAFPAYIQQPFPNRVGIWTGQGDQDPVALASTGTPAPGFGAGATFGSTFSAPTISDKGQVAFAATVAGGPSGANAGVFAGLPGDLRAIARTGDAAPGAGGAAFSGLLPGPSISRAGSLAFPGLVRSGGTDVAGVWTARAGDPGSLSPVVLWDTPLPGAPAGAVMRTADRVSINDAGSVSFQARFFTGGGVDSGNDRGIWMRRDGEILPVVYGSQQVPGLDKGVVFALTSNVTQTAINARSQLVFQANFFGPGVSSANDRATFAFDPLAGLIMVAREGLPFEVAPGDVRIVEHVDMPTSHYNGDGNSLMPSGTGGAGSALNDRGELVFALRFTDGTSGLFTTVIPTPGVVAALSTFVLGASTRRRRD